MLRRMKADMEEIKLPPKEELLIYVPLSPLQRYHTATTPARSHHRFWYKRLITKEIESAGLREEIFGKQSASGMALRDVKDSASKESNEWKKLNNLLIQLLLLCDQYVHSSVCYF